MQAYDYSTGSQSITGYEETVTPTEMFYKPFTAKVSQGALDYTYTSPFGYRQIDENTYNYYTPNKDGSFEAFRSYKGNVQIRHHLLNLMQLSLIQDTLGIH